MLSGPSLLLLKGSSSLTYCPWQKKAWQVLPYDSLVPSYYAEEMYLPSLLLPGPFLLLLM